MVEQALKELKAFARVPIDAGESRIVTFVFPAADIADYDENVKRFVVEPIAYEVFSGRHSLDDRALKIRFRAG